MKTDIILLAWLLVAVTCNILSEIYNFKESVNLGNLSSLLYGSLILFWIFSLNNEIPDIYILRRLQLGGVLAFLLFVLRVIRWNFADTGTSFNRLMWYMYYIPILFIPLISLNIGLSIGSRDKERPSGILNTLRVICIILVVAIITNDIHGLAFEIWYDNGVEHSKTGILLYVSIFVYFGLMLASFFVMLYKCRLSDAGKHWWIPAFFEGFGVFLWFVYSVEGGSSPTFKGIELYNIQEVYMLIFLGLWEGSIAIGLIPSVSLIKEREWIKEGVLNTIGVKLEDIKEIFARIWKEDGEKFNEDLIKLCCSAVFVKRRANLELISDDRGYLSSQELSLAIKESFDYYSFRGISVGYEETGYAKVPAFLLISAYEMFDRIMEVTNSACYVTLQTSQQEKYIGFKMRIEADLNIELDGYELNGEELIDHKLLDLLDADLKVDEEDDTSVIELNALYPVNLNLPLSIKIFRHGNENYSYGLSGLAGFLSLEKEALAAKIRIHDSLGRCLLMSKRYIVRPDSVDRDALCTEWSQVIVEMEGEKSEAVNIVLMNAQYKACIEKARNLGVEVVVDGNIPIDESLRPVIDNAITTHITNTIKHTSYTRAYVEIKDDKNSYVMILRNEYDNAVDTVKESGGLKNLRIRVESIGGEMKIFSTPYFCIILRLPKEAK